MTAEQEFQLHGFELPIHELMPGFLVPIFRGADGKHVLHHFCEHRRVDQAFYVSPTDKYLALSTLQVTQKPELELLSGVRVKIGDAAHRAFFDGKHILWGAEHLVRAALSTDARGLRERLHDYPFVLAQAFDFLGDSAEATRLRASSEASVGVADDGKTRAPRSRSRRKHMVRVFAPRPRPRL